MTGACALLPRRWISRSLLLLLALSPLLTSAPKAPGHKSHPLYDPLVRKGFEHFYNLEFPEAVAIFQQAVEAAPDDPNAYNHLAEAVLFGMMNRTGALESQMVTGGDSFLRHARMEPAQEEQALFASSIQKVLEMTGQAIEKNPNDADALFARGEAIGFRGTYNYMVKKSWIDSLKDATEARRLHNRVFELDPARIDARMMQGLNDYLIGSLPLFYKMLGFLAGFHGDREEGMRTLKLVAEQGAYSKVESEFLLCVIYRRERPRCWTPTRVPTPGCGWGSATTSKDAAPTPCTPMNRPPPSRPRENRPRKPGSTSTRRSRARSCVRSSTKRNCRNPDRRQTTSTLWESVFDWF